MSDQSSIHKTSIMYMYMYIVGAYMYLQANTAFIISTVLI